MRKLLFVGVVFAVFCVSAVAEDWIQTAQTGSISFYAQPGSYSITKNQGGKNVSVITAKTVDAQTTVINLEKWYVLTTDCAAKQGKIVTVTISGEYKYENDFVFGSGSIASTNAEFICGVQDYVKQGYRKKSL